MAVVVVVVVVAAGGGAFALDVEARWAATRWARPPPTARALAVSAGKEVLGSAAARVPARV